MPKTDQPEFRIVTRANYLAAAALFRSTEETRYYLNGVCIERDRQGGGINLISTDGHHGAIIRDLEGTAQWPGERAKPDVDPSPPDESKIIKTPPDLLRHCKPPARSYNNMPVWAVIEANAAYIVMAPDAKTAAEIVTERTPGDMMLHAVFGDTVIDATYPDFRRVVPERKPARSKIATFFGFNTALASNFAKASALLCESRATQPVGIRAPVDGTGPMWVTTPSPDLIGVLMPMRIEDQAHLGLAKSIIDARVGARPKRVARRKPAPVATDAYAIAAE